MARSASADELIIFHRAPNRTPNLSPTSLSEYEAVFLQEWRKEALCISQPPDLFFPESAKSNSPAKRICEMCAVRLECLDYAIETNQQFGIWGGTVERERSTIRKMMASRKWSLIDALHYVEAKRKGRSKVMPKDKSGTPKPPPPPRSTSTFKKVGDTLVEETGVKGIVRVWEKVKVS